jgi:lipopolysaccharide export LptBFGC system permease protein LptF
MGKWDASRVAMLLAAIFSGLACLIQLWVAFH